MIFENIVISARLRKMDRKRLYCTRIFMAVRFPKQILQFSITEIKKNLLIPMCDIGRDGYWTIYNNEKPLLVLESDDEQLNFRVDFHGKHFIIPVDVNNEFDCISGAYTKYAPQENIKTLSSLVAANWPTDSFLGRLGIETFTFHIAIELHFCETIDDV